MRLLALKCMASATIALLCLLSAGCAPDRDPDQRQVGVKIGKQRSDDGVVWKEVVLHNVDPRPVKLDSSKEWGMGPDLTRVKVHAFLADEDAWNEARKRGRSDRGPRSLTVEPGESKSVVLWWNRNRKLRGADPGDQTEVAYNDADGSDGAFFDAVDGPVEPGLFRFLLSSLLPLVVVSFAIGFWRKPRGGRIFLIAVYVDAALAIPLFITNIAMGASIFSVCFLVLVLLVVSYPFVLAVVAASASLRRRLQRRTE